jgi:carbonic anhydrase/acetyltransferase-like protein (isoleucine patch superfamily)
VGHGAVIHCATIKDNVVVGAQATILDGAVIGNGSIIGAHSVVLENMEIPPKSLVVGVPGKIIRSNDDSLLQKTQRNAELYHELRDDYRHNRYTRYDKCK